MTNWMTLWTLSLTVGAAVIVAVAVLLFLILRQAQSIQETARRVWEGGGRIANNTVHIPVLSDAGHFALRLQGDLPRLKEGLERLRRHAAACRGCPGCCRERTP
jgi:hypothetical protein